MLDQQVSEVHRKSHMFLGELRIDLLINGKLHTETDRVVPIDSERRRTKEYLVCLRIGDGGIPLEETIGTLADKLTKDAPIPFVWWFAPCRWAVAVNQTVIEHIGPTIAIVLVKLRERGPKPQVVTT